MDEIRGLKFEYRQIREDLEDIEGLDPSFVMKLQVRLCELKMILKEHEEKRKEEERNTFRKNAVPKNKQVREVELSDLRAFRHMLTDREICKKYNPKTLKTWRTKLNKGIIPKIAEELLKNNGYKVIQPRLWAKPKSKKYK